MESIVLEPERAAAARARRYVRSTCRNWELSVREIEDIELCTSELVTNAVLHARSPMRLSIDRRADAVRVSVEDGDRGMPRLQDFDPAAPTGRGMLIVDRLAREWGVEPSGVGKRVWFDVEVAGATEDSRTG